MLKNTVVRAEVVTVRQRHERGKLIEFAACERYSRIDRMLRIETGKPPALTGSNEGRRIKR
jgi:hypothetical protein